MDADVAVIGAGPAGSAAAAVLAAGGARVALADRAVFPRDKVCGDGLLPDALAALAELPVGERVRELAQPVRGVRLRSMGGRTVVLPLAGAVIRRLHLDALLLEGAAAAGAAVISGTLAGITAGDSATAVRLSTAVGEVSIRAGAVLLATGAARRPRELAGFGDSALRSAVALRGYARLGRLAEDELLIDLSEELAGGYAWAFHVGGGLWNVGCGLAGGRAKRTSMARLANRFLADLGGSWEAAPSGAPLLTVFPRLPFTRGPVAAVGDAAGLTRPFSGEGIGPSLWSGIVAAHSLLERPGTAGIELYRRRILARYRRDFRAWRLGEMFLRVPRLGGWLVARAHHPGARRKLAAVLADEIPAARVLSLWGLLRLLVRR